MIIFRHRRRLHKHIMLVRLHHHKVVQLFLNRLLYPHHLQVHVHLQRASLVEMTHDFRWQELHEAVRLTNFKKYVLKVFFRWIHSASSAKYGYRREVNFIAC